MWMKAGQVAPERPGGIGYPVQAPLAVHTLRLPI